MRTCAAYARAMGAKGTTKGGRRLTTVLLFLAGYVGAALLLVPWPMWLDRLILGHLPAGTVPTLANAYFYTLIGATAIAALGAMGRALGLRKGAWVMAARRFPTIVGRVLPLLPGVAWGAYALYRFEGSRHAGGHAWMYGELLGNLLGALGIMAVAAFASARARAAPMEREEDPAPSELADATETVFTALAVTPTTRAAVGALALLPLAFLVTPHAWDAVAFALYIATAFGSVLLLGASRIKVGHDGVYVTGSGPAQFHAWTSIDAVRAEGVDIVLSHGARAVLRLQLHGPDAARRDALVARFEAARTAAARARVDAPHVHAAHAASAATTGSATFVASVHDAGNYRMAAVNREQLWEIVEGAAAEGAARVLAAEALAAQLDENERARLRVAAEHCAEPRVRVALEELLDEPEDAPVTRSRALRRTI